MDGVEVSVMEWVINNCQCQPMHPSLVYEEQSHVYQSPCSFVFLKPNGYNYNTQNKMTVLEFDLQHRRGSCASAQTLHSCAHKRGTRLEGK